MQVSELNLYCLIIYQDDICSTLEAGRLKFILLQLKDPEMNRNIYGTFQITVIVHHLFPLDVEVLAVHQLFCDGAVPNELAGFSNPSGRKENS